MSELSLQMRFLQYSITELHEFQGSTAKGKVKYPEGEILKESYTLRPSLCSQGARRNVVCFEYDVT